MVDTTIAFLEKDHGRAIPFSPLPNHPLFEEFALQKGDMIVEFAEIRYIVYTDGGMSPICGGF